MSGILTLVLTAHAFAPSEAVYTGAEPNRIFRVHRPDQDRLRHSPGWEEFTLGEGRGWLARYDERTGTAHRAWGPGLNLGPVGTEAQVRAAMDRFLSRNEGAVGVPLAALRFKSARYVARTDTWYVDYDRMFGGVPVWRGGVTARFRFGKLVLFGADTYPAATVPQPELTAAEAITLAELDGPASMAPHRNESAELVVLPLDVPGGLSMRLCWLVRSESSAPLGRWESWVDAETGDLLAVSNDIRFLDGTVYGTHPRRTLDGDDVTTALPFVEVEGDSTVYADINGSFSVSGDSANTYLKGSYLTVKNTAGGEGSLAVSGSAPTWTPADATLAEIASYAFLHDVRAWGLAVAPEVDMSVDPLTSNVNGSDYTCNAYYDGAVNFFVKAGGCNNSGEIADVNYHEWGHGFHGYSLLAGTWDGSLGEGAGDIVAVLQTHDSEIGPEFMVNGAGIRDLSPDRVYPDDMDGEVHDEGLIFGGSVWDVWGELMNTYGETRGESGEAWDVTQHLFADALKAGPTIEASYDEFVVADDDDGDLSNGTPHFCDIAQGFALHGLGVLAEGQNALSVDHAPLENQTSGAGITVSGGVVNLAAACASFSLAGATVNYSLDDGKTWDSVDATVSGDSFSATFPTLPSGSIVWYYVETVGSDGVTAFAPSDGAFAPFSFYVGELEELYCDDFNTNDGDFTHELLDGDDREGADDWDWGPPEGMSTDPDAAYTGRKVWGNDLGGGNYNGDYQPSISNRLTTPPIHVAGHPDLIVQYRRWLNVEDGYYDQATVYGNDEVIWSNHASSKQQGDENTADDQWVLATHRASAPDGALTLAWELTSDEGFETGGWNFDELCVYAPSAADSRLVADFSASDDEVGKVTLSWTMPTAGGATAAVVVRRDDRYATADADGTVVYTGTGLVPGAPVTADDPFVGHGYYTVLLATDSGYAEGATAGVNADEGTGLADDGVKDDAVDLTGDTGCGCDAGNAASGLLGLGLAAAALARRRR